MGIGMMRRHYENDPESARVSLSPSGVEDNGEGGVVAIGDEPGTAPTPSVEDSKGREFDEDTSAEELEGQGEAPDANEKAASKDEFGDPEHSVDPEGHPVDHEEVAEHHETDPTTDEAGNSLGGPETALEAPSRGASTDTWRTFYREQLGQDPGERTRDELANDYLGPKPE